MKWVIDVGNSALKAAEVHDGRVGTPIRMTHREAGPGAALSDLARALRAPPTRIVWASVQGDAAAQAFAAELQARWDCPVHRAGTRAAAHGVRIAYARADQFGVDRWLALIAAHHDFPGDQVVADVGSALTVDVLRADGEHLGGIIVPGREAMLAGLRAATALTLPASVARRPPALARDTLSGVDAGVTLALAGAIREVMAMARERHGLRPGLILTGGDGGALRAVLGGVGEMAGERAGEMPVPQVVEDLVLRGLAHIANSD